MNKDSLLLIQLVSNKLLQMSFLKVAIWVFIKLEHNNQTYNNICNIFPQIFHILSCKCLNMCL